LRGKGKEKRGRRRRKEEGGKRKEEGGKRKEEGGKRKEEGRIGEQRIDHGHRAAFADASRARRRSALTRGRDEAHRRGPGCCAYRGEGGPP